MYDVMYELSIYFYRLYICTCSTGGCTTPVCTRVYTSVENIYFFKKDLKF
jgi:hypothetical protein